MKMTSLLLVVAILLNLVSPSISSSSDKFSLPPSSPEGWVGQNLVELVTAWGEPDTVIHQVDKSIYRYSRGRTIQPPGYDPYDSLSRTGRQFELEQTTDFQVDSTGGIVSIERHSDTRIDWLTIGVTVVFVCFVVSVLTLAYSLRGFQPGGGN